MFYTYVLYDKNINKFYIGYTDNIDRRIYEHKLKKGLKYMLVYYEACLSKKVREKEKYS